MRRIKQMDNLEKRFRLDSTQSILPPSTNDGRYAMMQVGLARKRKRKKNHPQKIGKKHLKVGFGILLFSGRFFFVNHLAE